LDLRVTILDLRFWICEFTIYDLGISILVLIYDLFLTVFSVETIIAVISFASWIKGKNCFSNCRFSNLETSFNNSKKK
jgi:hypothetical protein